MKILLASSELHPYSKSGGLADMVGALAKALVKENQDVRVITPLYRGITDKHPGLTKLDYHLRLLVGVDWVEATVWVLTPADGFTIYFIDQPGYYDRESLYQENGISYEDNDQRYIFFSKAVAHMARYLPWKPDAVHLHDWQTGLIPLFIRYQAMHEGWKNPPPTCLTIHNLAYQGVFPAKSFDYTNLPKSEFNLQTAEFFGFMNCLKSGLCTADTLTTVSPRYAREITTSMFGCGLDGVLRDRQADLTGILNGVDYEEWNTTRKNTFLTAPYTARSLAGKTKNKVALQKEVGLPVNPEIPLFGSITRLADQKGIDIMLGALEEMLAANMQFVQLGSGSPAYEEACRDLARRFPDKMAAEIGFNTGLSHRIEAGVDFFLMPSQFEPCGLNQMYSLRYGTIPVVRITGGLDDSVIDPQEDSDKANGIKFEAFSVRALVKAIRKALVLYDHPELLMEFRKNAMKADFGWPSTTKKYLALYQDVVAAKNARSIR